MIIHWGKVHACFLIVKTVWLNCEKASPNTWLFSECCSTQARRSTQTSPPCLRLKKGVKFSSKPRCSRWKPLGHFREVRGAKPKMPSSPHEISSTFSRICTSSEPTCTWEQRWSRRCRTSLLSRQPSSQTTHLSFPHLTRKHPSPPPPRRTALAQLRVPAAPPALPECSSTPLRGGRTQSPICYCAHDLRWQVKWLTRPLGLLIQGSRTHRRPGWCRAMHVLLQVWWG